MPQEVGPDRGSWRLSLYAANRNQSLFKVVIDAIVHLMQTKQNEVIVETSRAVSNYTSEAKEREEAK